jgi:hypothetical protein
MACPDSVSPWLMDLMDFGGDDEAQDFSFVLQDDEAQVPVDFSPLNFMDDEDMSSPAWLNETVCPSSPIQAQADFNDFSLLQDFDFSLDEEKDTIIEDLEKIMRD